MSGLVLSTFPGIGIWDRAMEEEGFCVVRGPDPLWGGDIRRFCPPSGVFRIVFGGPPCQPFSKLARLVEAKGYSTRFDNLIPEFERVVDEAQPECWLMENVPQAPIPQVDGYINRPLLLNGLWIGSEQDRLRRISFGTRDGRALPVELDVFQSPIRSLAFTSKGTVLGPAAIERLERRNGGHVKRVSYTLADGLRLQGLPADFLANAPFTVQAKMRLVANGVDMRVGRAIAQAVRRAVCVSEGMQCPRSRASASALEGQR